MEPVKVFANNNNEVIKVYHTDNAENPRYWCNLFTLITHTGNRNYQSLFDIVSKDFEDTFNQTKKRTSSFNKENIVFNLYAYIHGDISLSTEPYGDAFDSGLIGLAVISREDVLKTYKVKRITKKIKQLLRDNLKNELDILKQYANGRVYYCEYYKDGVMEDSCDCIYHINEYIDEVVANKEMTEINPESLNY
ncbi:MAG: hypothetical protein RSE41_00355 [Clostridia bacterium]